jgi:hypothetical protein
LKPSPTVSSHLRPATKDNILEVDELLVAPLPIPCLVAGVARVVENGPDDDLAPSAPAAGPVAVSRRVRIEAQPDWVIRVNADIFEVGNFDAGLRQGTKALDFIIGHEVSDVAASHVSSYWYHPCPSSSSLNR